MRFNASITFLLISLSAISSCKHTPVTDRIDLSSFPSAATNELPGNYELLSPQSIFVVDGNLLVTDNHDGKLVTRIYLDSIDNMYRTISVGNGPHEFLKVANIKVSPDNGYFWIDDNAKRTVSQYNISHNLSLNNDTFIGSKSYMSEGDILSLCPCPSGFIASGCFENGCLAKYNTDFTFEYAFGNDYIDKKDNESLKAYVLSHQSIIQTDNSGNYICSGEFYSDHLDFYENSDNGFQLKASFNSYNPDVDVISQSVQGSEYVAIRENDNTMRGFRDIVVSKDAFYALYWGVKSSEMNNQGNNCYVLKFSLKGEFVNGWRIEKLLRAIAYDADGDRLYAISYSPDGDDQLLYCTL